MQTFLPYPDPRASAAVLDDRRLGKQRVETFQALRALTWPQYGWKHHPVVRMWRGFVPALVACGLVCVDEWRARGRADATRVALLEFTGGKQPDWDELHDAGAVPPWVGDEALHLSHRSALVRKEPEHYRPIFGDVPDDLPYVWPDAAFPRWPLRRGSDNPLPLAEAAALLGFDEPPSGADEVVATLLGGDDVQLPLADAMVGDSQSVGSGATANTQTLGLLAGLCTPGTTLWVVDRPALSRSTPAPEPREGTGTVSGSIARQPSNADRLAMAEEAEAEAEFRFVRRDAATRTRADAVGAGLVVTPAAADPGAGIGRPRLVLP